MDIPVFGLDIRPTDKNYDLFGTMKNLMQNKNDRVSKWMRKQIDGITYNSGDDNTPYWFTAKSMLPAITMLEPIFNGLTEANVAIELYTVRAETPPETDDYDDWTDWELDMASKLTEQSLKPVVIKTTYDLMYEMLRAYAEN